MTDRIVFQKSGFPISPTPKVTRLKGENPDSEKRRFNGHLKEEEDEKKKDDQISLESKAQNGDRGEERKDKVFLKDGGEERGPNKEKGQDNDTPGSLLDVHA